MHAPQRPDEANRARAPAERWAHTNAWGDAKDLWLPCAQPDCDQRHSYGEFLIAHGVGTPPLHFARSPGPPFGGIPAIGRGPGADRRGQAHPGGDASPTDTKPGRLSGPLARRDTWTSTS